MYVNTLCTVNIKFNSVEYSGNSFWGTTQTSTSRVTLSKYFLLTEFEVRTVSYGPSFFPFDLWPKREARRP